MKCTHVTSIVAATLCFGAFMAQAQNYYSQPAYAPSPPPPPPDNYYLPEGAGPYFRAAIGPSFFQDGKLKQFGGPADSSIQYDTGLAADVAIGYAFNRFFSLDFETGYIGTEINNVSGYYSDNSRLYNVPLLVNAMVSAPIPHTNIVPYAGVGAGGAVSVFDTDNFNDGADFIYGHESDTVFAWQAFAGLRFMLNPQMSLGIGYKFFATQDPTFSYPPDGFNVGFEGVKTHSVLFTFQWNF